MNEAVRRAARTLLQLVAGGGLTVVVSLFAEGLDAKASALWLAGWTVFVTYLQNLLEDKGSITPVLGTKSNRRTGE